MHAGVTGRFWVQPWDSLEPLPMMWGGEPVLMAPRATKCEKTQEQGGLRGRRAQRAPQSACPTALLPRSRWSSRRFSTVPHQNCPCFLRGSLVAMEYESKKQAMLESRTRR